MKKITLVLGVLALVAISFSSCKKDYVCTCTTSGTSVDITFSNTTKADAKAACDLYNIASTTNCSLK